MTRFAAGMTSLVLGLLPFDLLGITPGTPLWVKTLDDQVFASPAVGLDGSIFISTTDTDLTDGVNNNWVYGLTPTLTGVSIKWQHQVDDWVEASPAVGPDGTVYYASWDGYLYAVSPDDGSRLWRHEISDVVGLGNYLRASPAIREDGSLIIPSWDGDLYSVDASGVTLFAETGGADSLSSPVIDGNGDLYIGTTEGEVIAFDSLGTEKWRFSVDNAGADDSGIESTPSIGPDGSIHVGCDNGYLYVLNPDGTLKWKFLTDDSVQMSPAIDENGQVFFSNRFGIFYCLDSSGTEVWSTFLGSVYYSSAVIDSLGFVTVIHGDGFGESQISSFTLDGILVWQNPIPAIVDSSPTVSVDGVIYAGGFDGKLYAYMGNSNLAESGWPKFGATTRRVNRMPLMALPTISNHPVSLWGEEGSFACLSVTAADATRYTWRRNRVPLGSDQPVVLLSNLSASDVGIYDVIVANGEGETLSQPAILSLAEETINSNQLDLTITQPFGVNPGLVNLESSPDLITWSDESSSISILADDAVQETRRFAFSLSLTPDERKFIQLRRVEF